MTESIPSFFFPWIAERLQKRENRKSYIFSIYFRENRAGTKDAFSEKITQTYMYIQVNI